MNAQDLQKHQWKNRLLLVLTDDINNQEFKTQIETLEKDINGLKERKLIIYQVIPQQHKTGFDNDDHWITSSNLYQDFKTKDKPFEIILIGLDGGDKLRQHTVLTTEKLFSIIDAMPMRRAEIRNKN
ncbi:DUF4174 domain-containing protein [Psychroserpens sp. Hel_I_66]|uniref:DUF4174 domain-containing protein n=1 Tax=Psychroserpens sp. Hel_I_66 TaxID=1250004 RepID=UPI000646E961|nr:DUF4174 domain-containing protein [Psychroserpens sp. Hel_I_66]